MQGKDFALLDKFSVFLYALWWMMMILGKEPTFRLIFLWWWLFIKLWCKWGLNTFRHLRMPIGVNALTWLAQSKTTPTTVTGSELVLSMSARQPRILRRTMWEKRSPILSETVPTDQHTLCQIISTNPLIFSILAPHIRMALAHPLSDMATVDKQPWVSG